MSAQFSGLLARRTPGVVGGSVGGECVGGEFGGGGLDDRARGAAAHASQVEHARRDLVP